MNHALKKRVEGEEAEEARKELYLFITNIELGLKNVPWSFWNRTCTQKGGT